MADKTISVYGKKVKEVTVRSYVAKRKKRISGYTRKDGTKVRGYTSKRKVKVRKHLRKGKVGKELRFDITGRGKELYKAVMKIKKEGLVPKRRFVDVEAEEFLEHPEEYAEVGEWKEEVGS